MPIPHSQPTTRTPGRARSPRLAPFTVAALALLVAAGCAHSGTPRTIGLLGQAGIPITQTPSASIPLEVVTKSTAVPDPLPVDGTELYYADLEPALGHAVSSATAPWAADNRDKRPAGWSLLVELTQARAEWHDGRLRIALNVRATLRTRVGNNYLAQTHANCSQAGLVPASDGAGVVFTCMQRIGRDLAGWLGGVES
ncbi:MAG: hypothetical protein NVS3B10_13380 [Polyangiales bacterium]